MQLSITDTRKQHNVVKFSHNLCTTQSVSQVSLWLWNCWRENGFPHNTHNSTELTSAGRTGRLLVEPSLTGTGIKLFSQALWHSKKKEISILQPLLFQLLDFCVIFMALVNFGDPLTFNHSKFKFVKYFGVSVISSITASHSCKSGLLFTLSWIIFTVPLCVCVSEYEINAINTHRAFY